jgi:integrase
MAVLNWATRVGDECGNALLLRNPLAGLVFPKEDSPKRPLLTEEQYQSLQDAANHLDWRFGLALTLVHETGHRIGAARLLRWSDIDLDGATVKWLARNDKIGFEHTTPLTEPAIAALRAARRSQSTIGDTWVFPSPRNPERPCSRHLMRDWWEDARKRAGLDHIPRLGWHALRRKFASELKHTPLRDLCELGGWKNATTVLTCYQQPDESTMRDALKLRRAIGSR